MMKKILVFIALTISAGLCAQQKAQQRVIHVQGHPHELLTSKFGGKGDAAGTQVRTDGNIANIDPTSIKCWAGTLDPDISSDYVAKAVLAIKWTDGKVNQNTENQGDSILVFGYQWNTISIYDDPTYGPDTAAVTKYTIDMIRAVANADCRFSALLENTAGGNFVVGGFGYNFASDVRVPVDFNAAGAVADPLIKFSYTGSPNCSVGQGAIPYDITKQVEDALSRSNGEDYVGTGTGIIRDPFDADYGYPAYDFDYWFLMRPTREFEWQSGWYHNGYWGFYTRNSLSGGFTTSYQSITQRVLSDGYTDGFVFQNMTAYPPLYNMSGNYTSETCNCGCSALIKSSSVKK